jgi:hypothetical protein
MEENFHHQIKQLINLIDLKKINYKLIKSNVSKLIDVYTKLKKYWNNIQNAQIEYFIFDIEDKIYNEIIGVINKNFLSSNPQIKKILSNTQSKYIHSLSYSNIYFYWVSESGEKNFNSNDYLMALDMFKITLSLNLYKFYGKDKIERYIIWIPINKKRDYSYKYISKSNLNKSQKAFEAFVASGVTFGSNPKITIITRYEEVEKLLIHELIHNYNIDGSGFHNKMDEILTEYKKVKNKGNYHYEYSIYESYTEMLSTYFYLLFTDIKLGLEGKELEDKLMAQILLEIIYSYNLICNLIKLNGYLSYDGFRSKMSFCGEICKYEYYYIKGLMYNNWELKFGDKLEDFVDIYTSVILMIKNIKITDDEMMNEIFSKCIEQKNFKYQIH